MSIEVEIKLRISDKECIEETLAEIGFCKGKFVMESDYIIENGVEGKEAIFIKHIVSLGEHLPLERRVL